MQEPAWLDMSLVWVGGNPTQTRYLHYDKNVCSLRGKYCQYQRNNSAKTSCNRLTWIKEKHTFHDWLAAAGLYHNRPTQFSCQLLSLSKNSEGLCQSPHMISQAFSTCVWAGGQWHIFCNAQQTKTHTSGLINDKTMAVTGGWTPGATIIEQQKAAKTNAHILAAN